MMSYFKVKAEFEAISGQAIGLGQCQEEEG